MYKSKKILGVLGGMGPKATLYFLDILQRKTPAKIDQDHIHTIIDINSKIPDRTSAILSNNQIEINNELKKSVNRLKSAGADFFMAPCNTVHFFSDALNSNPNLPFINLIEVTANALATEKIKRVGVLGTSGTINSMLYQKALNEKKIEYILPSEIQLKQLMLIIFEVVKKGLDPKLALNDLSNIVQNYIDQGAEKIILGCTELPIITQNIHNPIFIDPMEVIADVCIQYASE